MWTRIMKMKLNFNFDGFENHGIPPPPPLSVQVSRVKQPFQLQDIDSVKNKYC